MNKTYVKIIGILVLALLIPGLMLAQTGKVRGIVTDKATGDPLPGANITIEGTTIGASADLNGVYVILAVPVGVFTVRANFIGYQAEAISNIRVSSNQTTTLDFGLNQSAIQVEALEIVAERPIIQRNTTNTIRLTTQEDIENLPIRGLQNIIALNSGTVQQDGILHIRGGRGGEIAYFIDGASATNPLFNSENLSVIQEAIEEIQMQAGGFTAEFGGANSGIVNTTIRSGGSSMKATIDYRTDDFAAGGDEFLGTTSQGYHNVVATLGGPLGSKLRYFVAGQYNYRRNRNLQFIEPFSFTDLVDDGLEGRTAGTPLPGPVTFERNFLPENEAKILSLNSTVMYNFSNSIKFRLTGSYRHQNQPSGISSIGSLSSIFRNRFFDNTWKRGLVSLRATHLLSPTTFYDVSASWSKRTFRRVDEQFGDDWQKYADSRVWQAAGNDVSEWLGVFQGPPDYSTILNFRFVPPNDFLNSYQKNDQTSIGGSFDFTTQATRNIELKAGGRFDAWSMRLFNVGNIAQWNTFMFGINGDITQTFASEDERKSLLGKGRTGSIDRYGWDLDGVNEINDGPAGPRKPFIGSAYVQTKFEYRDLIVNFGLRYEKYDLKLLMPNDVENPVKLEGLEWIDESQLIETDPYTYVLPRVNFAFPVTDRTVFYAQLGRYVQAPNLNDLYRGGIRNLSRDVLPETRSLYGFFGQYVGFTAEPERTDQFELGIRQALTQSFAFTLTTFYKDQENLLRRDRILTDGTGNLEADTPILVGWINNDFGTSKGLEMTLELRRTQRLAARINYTLSSTRGTGSDSRSTRVAVSDATISSYPTLIYALDHNQTHRGTVMLDYRFAKGDGGSLLEGLGVNTLLTFNSGHNYTLVAEPHNLGQANPWNVGTRATQDPRGRNPVEPINTSVTPWNFNIDLNVDKMLYFSNLNVRLYANVLNLLNTRNIINVYESTGTDDDDGWLKSSLATQYVALENYENFYRAINLDNRWSYIRASGVDLWSNPRVLRFGISLEFQ